MNFEQHLQQKGIIPKTITRHQREVKKYESWLNLNHQKTAENTTQKELLNYLQHIKEKRQLQNVSLSKILRILKNYHQYLTKNYNTKNITAHLKIRGTNRKKLQALFTPDELILLCDAYYYYVQEYKPTTKEIQHYPNYDKLLQGRYIALTLMAYQGLQTKEISTLTKANFDLRKATVQIHAGITGASRILPLDASQIGVIIQHFDDETSSIIPNLNQLERLSKTLKELTLKPSTSITKFENFRQLRASKITHWIKLHGLRKAQHFAGHKNIQGTENYLINDVENLQNDMDNFHPIQ